MSGKGEVLHSVCRRNEGMWKIYSSDYIKNNRAVGYSIMAASFIASVFLSFLCSLFYNFWLDSAENGEKEVPVVLAGFYLIVVSLVCLSLILVIHNSFAVSMQSRLHQFGIFSSIGATPGQIRICLLQEAFMVSAFPIPAGILAGALCSFGTVRAMGVFAENLAGGRRMDFAMHPAIFLVILVLSLLTVLLSAWIPARKLSRITPLEAIRGTGELQLEKKKSFLLLSALFGVEGELAGNALRAQRKALRTTTLSLVFAFLGFMLMQCFFTLSAISTEHTYFEAYQDAWDVMVTVKNAKMEEFGLTGELRKVQGAESVVVYQKAEAESVVPAECISPELQEKGGPEALAGIFPADGDVQSSSEFLLTDEDVQRSSGFPSSDKNVEGSSGFQQSDENVQDSSGLSPSEEDIYLVKAPLVILDDESFAEYCGQIGIEEQTGGVVVYNRIWDSAASNFRYPEYIPYIKEDLEKIILCRTARPEEAGEEKTGEAAETVAEGSVEEKTEETAESTEKMPEELTENAVEIPILACSGTPPVLREEYEDYGLVQFMPLSLWRQLSETLGGAERNLCIRVIAEERTSAEALDALERSIAKITGKEYETESENRIQEKRDNDTMIWGYKMILGGLCGLFALIGIAGMFANTLGFLNQRKREFARLLSVGLTPESIRKIFCIEAAALVGRPLLSALVITVAAAACMIRMSYLNPLEFIRKAPVGPISVFILTVFGFTALAYWMGGRKILKMDLAAALRDDVFL